MQSSLRWCAVLVLVVGCSKAICGDWKQLDLPKVQKVNACDANGIHFDSTASSDDMLAAFAAHGWVAGQISGDYKTVRFRREGATFEYSAFELLKTEHEHFMIDRQPLPATGRWRSLADIAAEQPLTEVRAAALTKLQALVPFVEKMQNPPARCTRADLARVTNEPLEIYNLKYPDALTKVDDLHNEDEEIAARARLTRLIAAKVVFASYTRSFDEPSVSAITKAFSSGHAKADAVIMDAEAHRVLCAISVSARSSESLTQTYTPSGEAFGNDGASDLSSNLDRAVRESIAKLVADAH